MNKRQYLTDASSEREAYSAPNYERFTFETSGLVQASEEPIPVAGSVGIKETDVSTANLEW